jgi:hypothetical protein
MVAGSRCWPTLLCPLYRVRDKRNRRWSDECTWIDHCLILFS